MNPASVAIVTGVITCCVGVLAYIGKRFINAVDLVVTWRTIVGAVADLAKEVKEIKELLTDGREWMLRHDEKYNSLRSEVTELHGDFKGMGQRVTALERQS